VDEIRVLCACLLPLRRPQCIFGGHHPHQHVVDRLWHGALSLEIHPGRLVAYSGGEVFDLLGVKGGREEAHLQAVCPCAAGGHGFEYLHDIREDPIVQETISLVEHKESYVGNRKLATLEHIAYPAHSANHDGRLLQILLLRTMIPPPPTRQT
jgi:hypothetical protein